MVPDAPTVLVRLLASLHDDDGNVAVTGLHEGTAAPVDRDEGWVRAESGLLDGVGEIGCGQWRRIWAKPAITVIGIDTTPISKASNTLIPGAGEDQHAGGPRRDAATHLEVLRRPSKTMCRGARTSPSRPATSGQPYVIDATGPVYDAAGRRSVRHGGVDPVDMGMGGSIPFIAGFAALSRTRRFW